jgi:type III restriction/modification enzyme restriction subunit/helicase-like protein
MQMSILDGLRFSLPDDIRRRTLLLDAMRIGQRKAFKAGYSMVEERRKQYGSIVLPTRYGKSDVMRCLGMELQRNGVVSRTLALSPSRALRDQLVDMVKRGDMNSRYYKGDRLIHEYNFVGHFDDDMSAHFMSLTIQYAQTHLARIVEWIKKAVAVEGKPVLLEIDEGHSASNDNVWGEVVKTMVEAGCIALLFTATPYREDRNLILGFEAELVQKPAKTVTRVTASSEDPSCNTLWHGLERLYRLKADYEMTFAEAWKEDPWPICKGDLIPVESLGSLVLPGSIEDGVKISELRESRLRDGLLGRIVRSEQMIRACITSMLTKLWEYQLTNKDCAALVFCGNDIGSDSEADEDEGFDRDDQHPKMVERIIRQVSADLEQREPRTFIATEKGGAKSNDLLDHVATGCDILIVKQMAGVGIDIPRCKVVVDLSPVRSVAAWIQRIMRGATPYRGIPVFTLIAPADRLTSQLFAELIAKEGGQATETEWTKIGDVEKRGPQPGFMKPRYVIEETMRFGSQDTDGGKLTAEQLDEVEQELAIYPELRAYYTMAQLWRRSQERKSGSNPNRPVYTPSLDDRKRSVRDEVEAHVEQSPARVATRRPLKSGEAAVIRRRVKAEALRVTGLSRELRAMTLQELEQVLVAVLQVVEEL